MKKELVTVKISEGLMAHPTAMLVQVASKYDSRIHLECGSRQVNAKSIMGMMTLGLNVGEQITICADGSDEDAAIAEIKKFLTGNR